VEIYEMPPELRDVILVSVSLLAGVFYAINSIMQLRNKGLDNINRFMSVHQRLFDQDGYIMLNVQDWERGEIGRATTPDMERKFHAMLLDVERLAILANSRAAPKNLQVYMFGWYAKRIVNLISAKERDDTYWELALNYLDDLCRRSKDFEAMNAEERIRFMKRAT
jgi:hypothetical protein